MIAKHRALDFGSLILVALTAAAASAPANAAPKQKPNFVQAVAATRPLVWYRLQTANGASHAGTTTYTAQGTVTATTPGAPIGMPGNHCLQFDGKTGWIGTTQKGGINGAGSMMAWVKLAALPSIDGHMSYIAGESQDGNDFDMQFEQDNAVRFYTAGGSHVSYSPNPTMLANHWHLIFVTFDTGAHTRRLYWDGKLATADTDAGEPTKTSEFSIAESTVFGGRFFDGRIEDVALWNRSLTAREIAGIYMSTFHQ
jgi:hypothetical protein